MPRLRFKDNEDLAKWLRNELSRHRLNQPMLTRALGLSEGMVSRWCRGVRAPSQRNIKALSDYFGVDYDYLLVLSGTRDVTQEITDERDPRKDLITKVREVRLSGEREVFLRGILDDMLERDRQEDLTPARA